jgi:Ser/Thr protein kinase RdoA (MazF antagonist)
LDNVSTCLFAALSAASGKGSIARQAAPIAGKNWSVGMPDERQLEPILRRFLPGKGPFSQSVPGRPGLSGSQVFIVDDAMGQRHVLKQIAAHDRTRVAWSHGLNRHLRAGGLVQVPAVRSLAGDSGQTLLPAGTGVCWELLEWRPGTPVDAPTPAQAHAAGALLAEVHRLGASFVAAGPAGIPVAVPLCWQRRVERAGRVHARSWSACLDAWAARRAIDHARSGDLQDRCLPAEVLPLAAAADRIITTDRGRAAVAAVLASTMPRLPMQPALRDAQSDHFLYAVTDGRETARVTGLIDLHAAGMDLPLLDLVRLLGSWKSADPASLLADRWPAAWKAYCEATPLPPGSMQLAQLLHDAGVIGSLENWVTWLYLEEREFGGGEVVVDRVRRLVSELPHAVERLAAAGPRFFRV